MAHNDETISKCQHWLQQNISQNISLEQMADYCAMSKRNFIRRFKKALNETPANYLQQIRIEAAKRLLENTHLRFEDIVNKVGYEDSGAFRRVFTKHTNLSPISYREKFSVKY
jgi:transcriptional regulator GlxA family with amidase domain